MAGMFGLVVPNSKGYYRIGCHWQGEEHSVIVDDWIPCIADQPAFGRLGSVTLLLKSLAVR